MEMYLLPQRLAKLRKEKGLSQYELADALGYSRGQVANYEQGSRRPDPQVLHELADYFGVSVDYLLGRADDPRPIEKLKDPLPPDIRKIARAGEKMTPEQRERWLQVAKAIFPEAFDDEDK